MRANEDAMTPVPSARSGTPGRESGCGMRSVPGLPADPSGSGPEPDRLRRPLHRRIPLCPVRGDGARVKCAVVAGWMTTYGEMFSYRPMNTHYLQYITGAYALMDLPDMVRSAVPGR